MSTVASSWLDSVISHADSVAASAPASWLSDVRKASIASLKQTKWPTRKTEAFRFTSLAPLDKRAFSPLDSDSGVDQAGALEAVSPISDLQSIDLVVAGGQLLTDISSLTLPQGMTIVSLADATDDTAGGPIMASIKPTKHVFGLVNDAVATAGVIVNIEDNAEIKTPLRFIHLANQAGEQHSRIVVNVGSGASVTVIEQGEGQADSVNTAFAEYAIGQNAQLTHYRFVMFTNDALHAGGSHFRLEEAAQLNSTIVGYGSALSRLDIDVDHQGETAHAGINAMYLLAEGEHFDLQTTIEHAVPHCTTEENVRGIVGDRATANFNGRIHIHRYAQKTLAELNNRNLLLSRRGQVNTKPELEIYADDVKCAHGATVAEIDEQALYYLLSRGVSRSQALIMLNFGFIQELVNAIENPAILAWLSDVLRTRFAAMESK